MRVLSLGAGVQSTVVLLMAAKGEIPPIDHAVFADTGDEPAAVYRHLEWLEGEATAPGIPIHRVGKNNSKGIAADAEEVVAGTRKRYDQPPLFVRNADGSKGQIRRRCTKGHKIEPIERRIKHLAGTFGKRAGAIDIVVDQLFGISWDETQRMRDPELPWITYDYPLVDARMTRHSCKMWMEDHGYPEPPRSACVFCPYRSDHEWRLLRDTDPEGWQAAIDFDEMVRDGTPFGLTGEQYVHGALIPLREVDLSTAEDHGQGSFFGQECEGMCGV